jgi:probable HAF family extracellular repeat protein
MHMSRARKLIVAGFFFVGVGLAMFPPLARTQTQPEVQFLGRLSAKTKPEVSVFHLTVTEPGSSHGRDISLSVCGKVSPQELAKRLNRVVRLHGHFLGTGAPTDGFCATQLDFSPADGELTELPQIVSAQAISADKSVIIGHGPVSASNPDGTGHAFKYSHGQYTDLGTLGGAWSRAAGVSADGSVIVGSSFTQDSKGRAFRYSGGTMASLGSLGDWSKATGVSGDGKIIVGSTSVPDGSIHAFRYANGQMTDLGNMGGVKSYATAVSADGSTIVGYIITESQQHQAVTYSNGKATLIQMGFNSEAYAVSADGAVVVGWAEVHTRGGSGPTTPVRRPLVYSKGTPTILDTPQPQENSFATGVSADGSVVVGYILDRSFVYTEGTLTLLPLQNASAQAVSSDGQAVVGGLAGLLSPYQPPRGFLFQ